MSEFELLMQHFVKLYERDLPLQLYNTYRGVAISYPARVISVDDGYLGMSLHASQAVCLALEGNTRLQSDHFPGIYTASAVAVDVPNKKAILTDFDAVSDSIGQRASHRVIPSEPLNIEISTGDVQISGKIADISIYGIGIYTFAAYFYGNLEIKPGMEVLIEFMLPGMAEAFKVSGEVSSIVQKPGTLMHRMGVKTLPDQALESVLAKYVKARQSEILTELEMVYRLMCQEKK